MDYQEIIKEISRGLDMELDGSQGACGFEYGDTEIILQDAGDLLLIRADLGLIPEAGMTEIMRTALDANYLYQGSGGCTFARNPADGHLHLQYYNWLERLTAEKLIKFIEKLADTCDVWMKLIDDYEEKVYSSDTTTRGSYEPESAPNPDNSTGPEFAMQFSQMFV